MRLHVTSVANERVKRAVRLRDVKHRRDQGRFPIDGPREIARALAAGVEIDEVFVCPTLLLETLAKDLSAVIHHPHAVTVTPDVWQKLTYGERSDGVLVIGRWRPPNLETLDVSSGGLIAVLDNLEKPGNIGAILRSADAAGVIAVLVTGTATDLTGPNVIRSSTGVVFSLPTVVCTAAEAQAFLQSQRYAIAAARVEGATDWSRIDWTQRWAVVLGREDTGVSADWSAAEIHGVCLPMLGQADSLNVSVTAAVLFYESLRHRREHSGRADGQNQ